MDLCRVVGVSWTDLLKSFNDFEQENAVVGNRLHEYGKFGL